MNVRTTFSSIEEYTEYLRKELYHRFEEITSPLCFAGNLIIEVKEQNVEKVKEFITLSGGFDTFREMSPIVAGYSVLHFFNQYKELKG